MSVGHHRRLLWDCLTTLSNQSWNEVKPLVVNWWTAFKQKEANEKFNDVFQDNRMSVRTFGAGFGDQSIKSIGLKEQLNLSGDDDKNRFFQDSKYTPIPSGKDRRQATSAYSLAAGKSQRAFQTTYDNVQKTAKGAVLSKGGYWANRALDSSAFADETNFSTSEKKYDAGLHDLSASLLNKDVSIFDQIHNNEEGAQFSFMPLPKEEDQSLIYILIQTAKAMKPYWPEMYDLVRDYRSKMTRVKLAQNFDMGVGYIAIKCTKPRPDGRMFKLRYGLVSNLTVPEDVDPSKSIKVTPEVYQARQQAARSYKSILNRNAKNEIVIALRQHASGAFPVYAERQGNQLRCYDIVGGAQKFNGKLISAKGVMT